MRIARETGLKEGREEGKQQGIQEGIEQGMKENSIKIAKKLLNMGINSLDQIAEATNLTIKEIEMLSKINKDKNC